LIGRSSDRENRIVLEQQQMIGLIWVCHFFGGETFLQLESLGIGNSAQPANR
jgi:hypothetical protein